MTVESVVTLVLDFRLQSVSCILISIRVTKCLIALHVNPTIRSDEKYREKKVVKSPPNLAS